MCTELDVLRLRVHNLEVAFTAVVSEIYKDRGEDVPEEIDIMMTHFFNASEDLGAFNDVRYYNCEGPTP